MRKRNILTRREMLAQCSTGFGMLALQGLMTNSAFAGTARRSHFKPRAKHVILCYMSGGVSQVDSFDPKPKLRELHGKPMPVKILRTQFNNNGNVMASPFKFKRYGQSGTPVSSMFPHVAESVDELAVIRSMTSKVNEHAQGNYAFHTGFPFMGHPSAGAWVSYGLGTENQNMPGFVVLQAGGAAVPHGGVGLFSNGYLPAQNQASIIVGDKAPAVRNIQPREDDVSQRSRLDFVNGLDRAFLNRIGGDNDVEAAVRNYETAYRMQASVPELCDLSGETAATKKMYGMDSPNGVTAAYGHQALLARRLVERGVRFVELSCLPEKMGGGQAPNPWDQHGNLKGGHENMSLQVDQPIGGLLKDLKARGLLDDTLVIWAGEFGRTPFSQGSNGRDHNPYGYSVWLAGGGVKGGTVYGATDELGYHVTENKCDIYDLWATVLHLMGLDHEELTYRHGGRDLRLTDVHGRVIQDVIA
ncbi:MAG: DUF1501 domain-containing protein [Verrucomicrobia bacterium]|nr:MAG: DUF1501 domain-containing protein [Verrucomicrobiota bacterium]